MKKTGKDHFEDYLKYKAENKPQGWGLSLISSAFANYAVGQRELGKCYLKGEMGSPDKELARKWLQKAADQGDEEAAEVLKTID